MKPFISTTFADIVQECPARIYPRTTPQIIEVFLISGPERNKLFQRKLDKDWITKCDVAETYFRGTATMRMFL
jgi:hypothetical protein